MWRLCFPYDSENFVQFYFTKVYKDEDTLVYLIDNKPVASLQIIPYALKTDSSIAMIAYISGAMTHPDYRKQGYMESLLKASFEEMEKRGYTGAFLIPQEKWLFDFYRKYGFEEAFPQQKQIELIKSPEKICSLILRDKDVKVYTDLNNIDIEDAYSIYYRFLMEKENVVLKTQGQFSNIIEELLLDKGTVFINDWGIALAVLKEGTVCLKEFFYFDEEIRNEFIDTMAAYYPDKQIIYTPNSIQALDNIYKGMIKSLDDKPKDPNIYLGPMLD